MYAVVGCRDCDALWVVSGRPETTGCPRCGTRHRCSRLRRFVETEDEERAREARGQLLAERAGHGDVFEDLGGFDALADGAEAAGVTDEEYLAGSGLDVEAVEAARERAGRGAGGPGRSRRAVVVGALADLDAPTEAEVIEAAAANGVPEAAVRDLLERLVRRGKATRDGGRYRLL